MIATYHPQSTSASALAPFLRCPDQRCRQPFVHVETETRFRGALRCVRSSCRQRWFAEPLDAGRLRPQLEQTYEDAAIAADLMVYFRLPEAIVDPMFLHLPLTSDLWQLFINDRASAPRERTRRIVRRALDSLYRRAS